MPRPLRSVVRLGVAAALAAAAAALPVSRPAGSPQGSAAYLDSIRAWQEDRRLRMRSDSGWLTIAGFAWLEPGENRFGTDAKNAIVFPPASAPPVAGTFHLERTAGGDRIRVTAAPGVDLACNDSLVVEKILVPSSPGASQVLSVGRVTFWIIARAGRWAVRLRDPESPLRREFQGLAFFPVDPSYRIAGRFEPFDPPRPLLVPNVLGYSDSALATGRVLFALGGADRSLIPIVEDAADSNLFFVFRDATAGKETYGGGRFLTGTLEKDGRVILDFNTAHNPPCAFNPYTTCPMPPEGNDLDVEIRAGEMAAEGAGGREAHSPDR